MELTLNHKRFRCGTIFYRFGIIMSHNQSSQQSGSGFGDYIFRLPTPHLR